MRIAPPASIFRPRITSGRLLAGLLAGISGGVILGFPFYAILMADAEALAGPLGYGLFWILHMALSTSIGVVFSIFVAPRSFASSIASALLVVLLGVYGGGRVILAFVGVPFVLDALVPVEVIAHIVYAIVMGAGYVALHRIEVRDASHAQAERWRDWAQKEARAA